MGDSDIGLDHLVISGQTPWKYSLSDVDGRDANDILMYSILLSGNPCQGRRVNYTMSMYSVDVPTKDIP
jgi:hypothetical protein